MRTGLGWTVPHTAAFAPTDIAGCVLWLDASDAATITVSTGVSNWADKSGNANDATQGTAARQPATGTRTQNSLNVIDFDGTDDLLQVTGVPGNDQTQTGFYVVLADTTGRTVIGNSQAGGAGAQGRQWGNDGTHWGFAKSGVAWLALYNAASVSTATAYVVGCAISATDCVHNVNGSEETDSSLSYTLDANATQTQIGATGTGNNWNGWIAEVVIYDTQLGSTDRASVASYLNSKWAVY